MKRMNLRDVPDDVYEALVAGAESRRQSLSAFVVEQLTDIARMMKTADYLSGYVPPGSTGITVGDAVDAISAVRQAS
jgi:hypothetical protein